MKSLILVSGWSGPGVEWSVSPIASRAKMLGYKVIRFRQCSNGWGDIRHNGDKLAKIVESIEGNAADEKVFVVGHSMGGLIARYADVVLTGTYYGGPTIKAVATIGTPHHGTALASAAFFSTSAKQMAIGSDFLRELNGPLARYHSAKYLSIQCAYDQLVFPGKSAVWDMSDGEMKVGTGHVGAILKKSVAKDILDFFEG